MSSSFDHATHSTFVSSCYLNSKNFIACLALVKRSLSKSQASSKEKGLGAQWEGYKWLKMPAHCLPLVMISIVFWKRRKSRFCQLLVPCFRQPPLAAAEMLSLPLACWKIDSVGVFPPRAKLRRYGNVHLWRYLWTSRQEMVHLQMSGQKQFRSCLV